jgi:hypothetical protein
VSGKRSLVADLTLENRLLKKSMIGDGGDVDAQHRAAMTNEISHQ